MIVISYFHGDVFPVRSARRSREGRAGIPREQTEYCSILRNGLCTPYWHSVRNILQIEILSREWAWWSPYCNVCTSYPRRKSPFRVALVHARSRAFRLFFFFLLVFSRARYCCTFLRKIHVLVNGGSASCLPFRRVYFLGCRPHRHRGHKH